MTDQQNLRLGVAKQGFHDVSVSDRVDRLDLNFVEFLVFEEFGFIFRDLVLGPHLEILSVWVDVVIIYSASQRDACHYFTDDLLNLHA